MSTKIIKFIGFSGSGKTTLIEKIVKKLSDNGVKVATIKHDVHGLDIDKVGKDSYRYSMAGAQISVVSSPDMTVYKVHRNLTLNEILENVKDVDLIIIEGYSNDSEYPTFCVARKGTNKGLKGDLGGVKAVISDYSEKELKDMGYNGPCFDINNEDDLYSYIMDL